MATQTLSEIEFYQWMNESLVKLESQLQTLCNEFRSIRTAWEAPQTSVFALAPPLPSVTAPLVPSPASATTPPSASLPPKPSLSAELSSPKRPPLIVPSTSISVPTKTKPLIIPPPIQTYSDIFKPKSHLTLIQRWCPSNQGTAPMSWEHIRRNFTITSNCWGLVGKQQANEDATEKSEWHPPWWSVTSAPNVMGRTEWRPPWRVAEACLDFILEDKDDLRGVE
ncbi:hypothetical protein HanRHA438_Chr05g0231511 [Helianthus annuus]|uniref:Uncharacterized protein n=1 Tax=Helianthus annuus TaxID=4232 RepID=A0A9K3NN80_HELAN|nr:hypothetical protein HanXRQr2_Chr05g0222451 [Helianthus annuus]KAJ0577736.1 hypothetical protein HanIR_Chr05g0239411 [Helianthus annuus]KAJ0919600.1 hypothetical protein HanRHA438_Chr05g0231511 [Helianthus annuus]KAJ0923343.1 hypothetical protein HanPSC8_Chr05g0214801 [Helianthus annuus]